MRSALIGHTGFVGGTLQRQVAFDDGYNSSNIEEIAGQQYGLIVCAGAPAIKWKANREPEEDLRQIRRLMDPLGKASANHVILISTVDVYPSPVDVDEATPIDSSQSAPYGRHRRMLEEFVAARFDHTTIRLPGLFGKGLRKNIIYDFLHDNALDAICPESVFQFYHLATLWADVERVRNGGVRLMNFATEPISVRDIAAEVFGRVFDQQGQGNPARYDFRTRHGATLGRNGEYIRSRREVLDAMKRFVADQRLASP